MDAQNFLKAWKKAPLQKDPYLHFHIKDIFDPELLKQVRDIPFQAPGELDYKLGRREEFNSHRQFFNPEVIRAHPCAKRVADIFLTPDVIKFIEKAGGIDLKDSLLRVEYTLDTNKFWLEPHTDIGVKNFTMVVYLSDDEEAESWGTDVYADAETHIGAVPAYPNSALIFFPSNKTWHGFKPRVINGLRKTLIVNYVTQEWRNRQELVHPTNTMQTYLEGAA